MHRAVLAVVLCPSVCLSFRLLCHSLVYSTVSKRLNISANFFRPGSAIIPGFEPQNRYKIQRWTPWTGVWNRGGWEKFEFSANISLYLGNSTRQGHSYHRTLIESRMFFFEPCYFRWTWVILKGHFSTRKLPRGIISNMLDGSPIKPFTMTVRYV